MSMPRFTMTISANITVKGTMLEMMSAGRRPRNTIITAKTTRNVCPTLVSALFTATVTFVS